MDWQKWLSDRDLREVSARTGVRYLTLWRIKRGKVASIKTSVRKALEGYVQ